MKTKIVFIAALVLSVVGCSSTPDVKYQQYEVKTMKRNIKTMNIRTGEDYTAQLRKEIDFFLKNSCSIA